MAGVASDAVGAVIAPAAVAAPWRIPAVAGASSLFAAWQLPLAVGAAFGSVAVKRLREWLDRAALFLIRPPRCEYDEAHLGPAVFSVDGGIFERADGELHNPRGQRLVYSWWQPAAATRPAPRMPCVLYLHSNGGARVEALEACTALLPRGVTVFAFDFAGSGQSDGDYVTLGHYEQHDVAAALAHVLGTGSVSTVGLWGRSLGAACAVIYAARDPAVGCVVADSCYASLSRLLDEMALQEHPWTPHAIRASAIAAVANACGERAGLSVDDVDPAHHAARVTCPGIVANGDCDTLINPEHSNLIHQQWGTAGGTRRTPCSRLEFPGDHNSERPEFFREAVADFCRLHLGAGSGAASAAAAASGAPSSCGRSGDELSVPPPQPAPRGQQRRAVGKRGTAAQRSVLTCKRSPAARRRQRPAGSSAQGTPASAPAEPPPLSQPPLGAFDETAFQRVISGQAADADFERLGSCSPPQQRPTLQGSPEEALEEARRRGPHAGPDGVAECFAAALASADGGGALRSVLLNLSACQLKLGSAGLALQLAAAGAAVADGEQLAKAYYRMGQAFEAVGCSELARRCALCSASLGGGKEAEALAARQSCGTAEAGAAPARDHLDREVLLAVDARLAELPLPHPAARSEEPPAAVKARGNDLWRRGETRAAADTYSTALGDMRSAAAVLAARAECHLAQRRPEAALLDSIAALTIEWDCTGARDARARAAAALAGRQAHGGASGGQAPAAPRVGRQEKTGSRWAPLG